MGRRRPAPNLWPFTTDKMGLLPVCRRWGGLSHAEGEIKGKKYGGCSKPPYLCIRNNKDRRKQLKIED